MAAGPAVLVSAKLAGVAIPVADAVILKAPAVVFAVNAAEVASPVDEVIAVLVEAPPKLALAPEPGAVKVTVTPDTGFPSESFTVATSGLEKAVLIWEVCGVPLVGAIATAGPARFVSEKRAPADAPGVVALIL